MGGRGSLDPWMPGSADPWSPGSLDPWIPGSLDPWIPGSLDPLKGRESPQLLLIRRKYIFIRLSVWLRRANESFSGIALELLR